MQAGVNGQPRDTIYSPENKAAFNLYMLTFPPGMPVQFNTEKLKKRPDLKDVTGTITYHNEVGGQLTVRVDTTGELVEVKKEDVLIPCFDS